MGSAATTPLALIVGVLTVGPAASGCAAPTEFPCASSSACNAAGGGVCEADGACAYPDPACASGRRYGPLSGEQRGECTAAVGDPDDGGPTGDAFDGGFASATWSTGFGKVVCAESRRRPLRRAARGRPGGDHALARRRGASAAGR